MMCSVKCTPNNLPVSPLLLWPVFTGCVVDSGIQMMHFGSLFMCELLMMWLVLKTVLKLYQFSVHLNFADTALTYEWQPCWGMFSLHLQLRFHGKFLDSGVNEEWRIPIKFQFMFNIPSLIEKFLSFLADGACFMDHAADSFSLHIWWVIGIKEKVTSIMVTFPVDLHSQCSSVFWWQVH
jgi:hypothetical protein